MFAGWDQFVHRLDVVRLDNDSSAAILCRKTVLKYFCGFPARKWVEDVCPDGGVVFAEETIGYSWTRLLTLQGHPMYII